MHAPILLVFIAVLSTCGCASTSPELAQTPHTNSTKADDREKANDGQTADIRPVDEEDSFFYRLLAAPEYLWKGLTYPIKKMSIFYEQVDLLERALDIFLNEERTGGVFPRFEFGGAIGGGIGLTAFHNNLFNKKNAHLLNGIS